MESETQVESVNQKPGEKEASSEISGKTLMLVSILVITVVIASIFLYYQIDSKEESSAHAKLNPTATGQAIGEQKIEDLIGARKEQERLLLSEIKKENISISDGELDAFIRKGVAAFNMSEKELQVRVRSTGMTFEEYREKLRKNLEISQLIRKKVDLQNVSVSEKEVDDFIDAHAADFGDLLKDESKLSLIKSNIRMNLIRDKQMALVREYIAMLSS